MDKQKEIEKMAKLLYSCFHTTTCECCNVHCVDYLRGQVLVNAGYGDVRQAVREFADSLKNYILKCDMWGGNGLCKKVDELVKEVCGE